MININSKQLEWLITNKPNTDHDFINPSESTGEFHPCRAFNGEELEYPAHGVELQYFLTPNTYSSMPIEFKDLANTTPTMTSLTLLQEVALRILTAKIAGKHANPSVNNIYYDTLLGSSIADARKFLEATSIEIGQPAK